MSTTPIPSARLLLLCGSLRNGSTNAAVLQTALCVAPDHADLQIYGDLAALPHFNPDDELHALPPSAAALRAALAQADGVLISTPEYAGALPGSFKNLLDWTVGDGLYQKPIGWINASAQGGAQGAHAMLRVVLGYVNADVVEAACVNVPVRRDSVSSDGVIADSATQQAIRGVIDALLAHIAIRRETQRE